MTSSAHAKAPAQFDRERLYAVIAPVVHAHGGEVVDVELKTETGGWVLRIFVEKLGAAETNLTTEQAAVDLELCSQVARDLSPALDVADLIPHRYHLEISSPGVERPLRDRRDFIRFAGQKAKLKLHHAVDGQKVLVGILGGLEGDDLLLDDAGKQHRVPFGEVSQARLVFEFGPRPRPGKAPTPTKPNKNHTK
jgi:ribosome maturation factor RimP